MVGREVEAKVFYKEAEHDSYVYAYYVPVCTFKASEQECQKKAKGVYVTADARRKVLPMCKEHLEHCALWSDGPTYVLTPMQDPRKTFCYICGEETEDGSNFDYCM